MIDHLTSLVRCKEQIEHRNNSSNLNSEMEKGDKVAQPRMTVRYVGGADPHFAHANLYCDIACERIKSSGRVIIL